VKPHSMRLHEAHGLAYVLQLGTLFARKIRKRPFFNISVLTPAISYSRYP